MVKGSTSNLCEAMNSATGGLRFARREMGNARDVMGMVPKEHRNEKNAHLTLPEDRSVLHNGGSKRMAFAK